MTNGTGSGTPTIAVRHLWKVFGPAEHKIVGTKFVQAGGDAWTLVKNFTWTNADQNLVSDDIANHNMPALDAAKKWLDAHQSTWKPWMPAS